jgi:hypothetical protein
MVTFANEIRTRLTELDRPRLARFVAGTGEGMLLAARSSALYSELGPATQEVTEVNDWDLSGRPD